MPGWGKAKGAIWMWTTVFDSDDLCVIASDNGASKGVITFGTWLRQPNLNNPAATLRGFGHGVFLGFGMDELHIIPRRNHWYQTPDLADATRIARDFAQTRKVVTYGSSMGGYGAALMSARLGVPAVSLAPQYSLDAEIAPWETRWREDAAAIAHFDSDAMSRDGLPSGYLFYDPFTTLDAKQASLFRPESNFTFMPCAFSGHSTSFMVNRSYSLKRLVREVLDDSFSVPQFYAERRAYDRRHDDVYISGLYVRAAATNKRAIADWAARQLQQMKDQLGAKSIRALYFFETRRGRKDLAGVWTKAASALTPRTPGDCFIAARLAIKGDLHDDARRILQHGLTLAPANLAIRRELAALT